MKQRKRSWGRAALAVFAVLVVMGLLEEDDPPEGDDPPACDATGELNPTSEDFPYSQYNLWSHSGAEGRGRVRGSVPTGVRVRVLEERGGDYRIRTADGSEGWIGAVQFRQVETCGSTRPATIERCEDGALYAGNRGGCK